MPYSKYMHLSLRRRAGGKIRLFIAGRCAITSSYETHSAWTVERRREQQYGGLFLGFPIPLGIHPFVLLLLSLEYARARSDRFYNRFTNSPESLPRAPRASSHSLPTSHPRVYHGVPHQPLSTPETRKFIVSGARTAMFILVGEGYTGGRTLSLSLAKESSWRNAVIDRVRWGRHAKLVYWLDE